MHVTVSSNLYYTGDVVLTFAWPLQEKSEKARLSRELSYRELKEKRATEILSDFHKTKALWEKKAVEESQQLDSAWVQQGVYVCLWLSHESVVAHSSEGVGGREPLSQYEPWL